MASHNPHHEGEVRLDFAAECIWRGASRVTLKAKAFAVLRYLAEHPERVIPKEELLQAVWPGTVVSDWVLTTCVREIRRALHDDVKTPRFIETAHRRGYRFIAPPPTASPGARSQSHVSRPQTGDSHPQRETRNQEPPTRLVGRDSELSQLHQWLDKALNGDRQLIFVTGEPGIGKTALVATFRQHLIATEALWMGHGQCIEHYGPGEPYMPILEALGRLCRAADGKQFMTLLGQHAPTWLVQMPTLLNAAELETLQRKTAGATRERMLRELGEALDAVTAERLLVLWLEDLHWSDASTLEFLALLARRREPTRLLVIGTYRPGDVIVQKHPLRAVTQELQLHGLCEELPLRLLSEAQVAEYLEQRVGAGAHSQVPLQTLAKMIHRRTDGNPLFMVTAVEDLVSQGVLVSSDGQFTLPEALTTVTTWVPDTLQQLIDRQLERLSVEERRVVEVASVTGMEFSAASVAAGLATEVEAVEEWCGGLADQGRFLRASGTAGWPDGTVAARYSFLHALYQEVLYKRIPAARRQRLHQLIGEREEQAYGKRAREIAAELAVHYERGRDYPRAVQYLQQAGENAVGRSAHKEAINLFTQGLELLQTLPDALERAQRELALQLALALPLMATKGFGAPEVATVRARALDLSEQVGESPQLFPALWGVCVFYWARGELRTARELAERLLPLAQRAQDTGLLLEAHFVMGSVLYASGELVSAHAHYEHALALYDPRQRHAVVPRDPLGTDRRATGPSAHAHVLWLLGYPDQARTQNRTVLTLAQEIAHPETTASVWSRDIMLHEFLHDARAVQQRAEALGALSNEYGYVAFMDWAMTGRGWALAAQGQTEEGIQQLHQGLAAARARGIDLFRPHLLALLTEAYERAGRAVEGLSALAEALITVDKGGGRFYEAELYRLKGTLTLQSQVPGLQSTVKEAEACFLKAIDIARKQQAKSLELRATTSLARLWQQQGKTAEAHKLLSEVYNWFTEGFDTKDLQEAKALLEELT